MSSNGHTSGAGIRARLNHPVIDADGHWLEFGPMIREQMRKIGATKRSKASRCTANSSKSSSACRWLNGATVNGGVNPVHQGGVKLVHYVMQHLSLPVVPVVHRRAPRCFV